MEPFVKLAIFALLFTASTAVPLQHNAIDGQCAQRCRADPRFLRYQEGKSYVYAFQTTTVLDDQQPIALEGAVVLSALANCDVALQLRRVRIRGLSDDATAQMQTALERWPLHFGYSDGVVTDVCVTHEEPQWTLNVKKAFVSALQMSSSSLTAQTTVQETDVQGACVTQYEPISERFGKHVIRKTKNFGDCDDRQQWFSGFFPKAYSRLNQIPVTSGQQQCIQSIEADVVFGVTCEEQQTAFGNGFALKSQLNLRLERQLDQLVIDNKQQKMQRHYNHLKMTREEEDSDQPLEATLQQLCQQMAQKSAQSAQQFAQVVRAVKTSSPQQIQQIHAKIEQICPQQPLEGLFLDACAHAGSEGAIKAIQKSLQKQKNSLRTQVLFHNLAFVSQPEVQSLSVLADILEQHSDQQHVTLGVSAFFHNAKHASRASRASQQYKASEDRAIQHLLRRIGDQSANEFEKTVAIKALQNIGLERQQRARQALAQLAQTQNSPQSARVAALKALSDVMGAEERSLVAAIVENDSESNEIRVNAIKALIMSGSNGPEVERIKRVAERSNENIRQYAQSLVKNLQETSDPHKKDIWRQTGSAWKAQPMAKWFGISNNFETSFMVDALGVGAVLESDVIYEQQSAGVPSSVVINATLPLMGREVNLIEAEVRQKGFERILEKKLRQIYGSIQEKNSRQLVDALLQFASQWENEIHAEKAFIELTLRVDSKTVFFFNSRQKESRDVRQLLRELSPEGAFAFQPVNTRVAIPSGNGWPLVARVNSTLLYKNSANHVISPLFVWQTEAGIQLMAKEQRRQVGVAFNVQSAPAFSSLVDYSQNRFQWKVSLPEERISLLKSAAEVTTRAGSEGLLGGSGYQRCSEWTKKAFGFEVCFAKNAKEMEVFVKKTDSIQELEVMAEKRGNNGLKVLFNTPGSRVDRHWELDVERESTGVKMALKSPLIRLTGSAQLRADEKEQSFQAEVERDGQKALQVELALEQVARGQKREFRPRVQLSWQQQEVLRVGGSVSVAKGRKNQLMINLEGNQKQFLKGSLVREGDRKSADIRVSCDLSMHLSNGLEAKVNALFDKSPKHVTSDLQLEYRSAKSSRKESLKTSIKLQSVGQSASAQKLSAVGEVTSTQFPQMNCHLAYNLLNKMGEHVENELTVQWAENLSRKVHILQVTKVGDQMETTVQLEVTPLHIDYELRASAQQKAQEMAAQVSGKDRSGRSAQYDFKTNVQYKHVSRAPLHLTLAAELKTASQEFKYSDELREVKSGEYKGQTALQWATGGQPLKMAKMDYDYKKKSGADHEMALQLQSPLTSKPIKHTALLRMSRHSAHVKSRLQIGDRLHHHVEGLLSSEGPNRVHVQCGGYEVKGHVHAFELPQRAGLEVVTPSQLIHRTDVEIVPQKSFRLKSDTKRENANIFALESDIQRSLPSKVVFNGQQIEGKLDFRSLNGQHSAEVNVNHILNDWTHSSALKAIPEKKTFEVQSKTVSKGLPLLVLDSSLDRKQQKVNFLLPQKRTSLLWDSTSGPKRSAKLELNCGQNFRHISEYANTAPEVHRFDSQQTDFRSGSPLYALQYQKSGDGHQLSGHYLNDFFVDSELKPWNQFGDRQGSASVTLKNKRSQFEHNSKIAFDNRIFKLESQTRKQNQNLAEIEGQLAPNESQLKIKLPAQQTRAQLVFAPQSQTAKLQYSAPNADHVTSLEWAPNRYACDSKTTLDNHVTYALAGNHAPNRKSFLSIKTPNYDVSGHVDRTWDAPSAKVTVITPRSSHVTEVSANRNRKSIRIESRADRKSGPEVTENVYNLDANYNHLDAALPSTLALKIARNLKISAKVQPFAQHKSLQVAAEHPNFSHQTDVTVAKHVVVKSRTQDRNGRNLAKIDSSLPLLDFKGEKSHVTLVSPHLDTTVEIDPRRSVRFQYRDPKWTHSSTVSAEDLKWNLLSNTKLNGQQYADLSAHFQHQQPISAQIALKTPSIGHQSRFQYAKGLQIESNTEYENQLLNQIRFDSAKHFDLTVPHFQAQTQWSPEGAQVDYRSRMPSGRHVLASIRAPRDRKQFGVDVAWDQQRDPNQRLKLEWEARDAGAARAVHVLRGEYAGNALIAESSVQKNDVIYGPNEWSLKYVPKYNSEKDSLELRVNHVIKEKAMECHVTYIEGQKPKVDAKLVTKWAPEELSAQFESTSAQNPDLNVKMDFKARVEDLRTRNAKIMTEIRVARNQKQYALEWHVARAQQSSGDEIRGEMSVETPSGGRQQMDFRLNVKQQEIQFSAKSQDRKLLEVNARADNERADEKHVSLELKSNIADIPSVSVSGDYFRSKELSLRAEVDGERKAEVSLIRTGSDIQSGSQVTFRAETSLWPKIESLLSLKKNSEEIDFEFNAKIDSKEVFSAILKGKKTTSGAWSGQARVSDNGSQLAQLEAEATSGQSASNFRYELKGNSRRNALFGAMRVLFSVERNRKSGSRVKVNACQEAENTCFDVNAFLKHVEGFPERLEVSVQKNGKSFELKTSFAEHVDDSSSGPSLLGLTSGRVQQKTRNQVFVAVNGHQMGFELTRVQRGRHASEHVLHVEFPSKKEVTLKSDSFYESGHWTQKTQVVDIGKQEVILETEVEAVDTDKEFRLRAEAKSEKFGRNKNKKVEFWFQKPTEALKVDFRSKLVINVNNNGQPITVETALERTPPQQQYLARQQRSLWKPSSALNNTFVIKISDQKKIDFRFVAHASQQTTGFEVSNKNRRGVTQFAHLFVQSEPSSGEERRFHAIASTNQKRYRVRGAWLSNELNYEITDEKSGQKSDVRVALKGKCVTVEAREERAHKKYDLCVNYDNQNDESIQLALEETKGGESRQMSANLEVDTRGRQSVKIDVTWTPQLLSEWAQAVTTWFGSGAASGDYFAEIAAEIGEEVAEKWSALSRAIAEDVFYPVSQLVSDQSVDLLQELQKIFGNLDRLSQSLGQAMDALYRQWERLSSHVSQVLNAWTNTWRPVARGARKQCQKLELCYKLLYGMEKYGVGAVYDYFRWNSMRLLRESHRLLVVTSGRVLVSLPAPAWLQNYKESAYGVWQSIIASNPTLQSIVDTIDQLVREVNKDFEEIDAKKVKTIGVKLLAIVLDASAQRVVVWDPSRGRFSLEVTATQLRRQLRSTRTQYRKLSEFWV